MAAVYTDGFARAFDQVAEATGREGADPCAGLPELVRRVVAQAKILNPDSWHFDVDELCRELRRRLVRIRGTGQTPLPLGRRNVRRDVYQQGLNLLEFARDPGHD